ncbi:hypothetical protein H4R33_007231, partial [Dimargaris cristalligena]
MYFQTIVLTLALTTLAAHSHVTNPATTGSSGQLSRRSLSSDTTLPQLFRRTTVTFDPFSKEGA